MTSEWATVATPTFGGGIYHQASKFGVEYRL